MRPTRHFLGRQNIVLRADETNVVVARFLHFLEFQLHEFVFESELLDHLLAEGHFLESEVFFLQQKQLLLNVV